MLQNRAMLRCRLSDFIRYIIVSNAIDFDLSEIAYVFIVLLQLDLKHVRIQVFLLKPLVVWIPHLILLNTLNSLQGQTDYRFIEKADCVDLVFIVPEGSGRKLDPARDEIGFNAWLEAMHFTFTNDMLFWVNDDLKHGLLRGLFCD